MCPNQISPLFSGSNWCVGSYPFYPSHPLHTHTTLLNLGQSKKKSVSGGAAGCLKKGRLGTLFFIFAKKNNFYKNGQYFPTKKKKKNGKKRIVAAQLTIITATRSTGNRLFFVDSLKRGRSKEGRFQEMSVQRQFATTLEWCHLGVRLGNQCPFFI